VQTRNRHSAESKGSAFVWYQTWVEAARAMLSLHGRYAFPDAKGDHVRLVTVRPAVKGNRPFAAPMLPPPHNYAMPHFGGIEQPNYLAAGLPSQRDPYVAAPTADPRLASQLSLSLQSSVAAQYDDLGGLQARQFDPAFLGYMDPQAGPSAAAAYSLPLGLRQRVPVSPGQMEMGAWEAAPSLDHSFAMLHHQPPTHPGQLSITESLAKLQLTAMQNSAPNTVAIGEAVAASASVHPPVDMPVSSGLWP
jgi:hypothetical protein